MYTCKYPYLFEPVKAGNRMFRNRIFAAPTGTHFNTVFGFPADDAIAFYERKAVGGSACVCVGDACVDSELSWHRPTHIAMDDWFNGKGPMTKLSEAINRHGAVSSIELVHAGGCAAGSYAEGHTIYGPVAMQTTARGKTCIAEPMTEELIERAINKFYEAALTAKKWGYGMITLHGGHGWLLTQFMSPKVNTRTDKWGGTFENRMRFPLAVIEACRKAVGPGFPISIRISGDECFDGGYDIDYGIKIAEALDGKVDIINVSAGHHENDDTFTITHPSMFLEDGCNVKFAAAIKPHVRHSLVSAVGAISDPAMMEEIIASGKADIIEMARGILCDPDLPYKARTGHEDEIRRCMRCFECFSSALNRGHIVCAQNPELSNELEFKYTPKTAPVRKKVLIAGGGPAGMQAAITAKKRGHDVILCEKTDGLGGVLRCEKAVPFKAKLEEYLDHQAKLLYSLGVDVRLNTAVDREYAEKIEADVILCALGADPVRPPIPGIEGENVIDAAECYEDPRKAGEKTVIIGGGLSGSELAIYLNKYLKKECVLVEMAEELNFGLNMIHGLAINTEIKYSGIDLRLGTRCEKIAENGVYVRCGDKEEFIEADTVVIALGMQARSEEAAALALSAPQFYLIGDCNTPGNVYYANDEAYHVAADL